jgi:hypothetical protein
MSHHFCVVSTVIGCVGHSSHYCMMLGPEMGPEMGLMDIHVTIQVAQGLQQKGT